jgi:antibiotic biosynthesis monooxygenase (ABM) superfamily enzyme
MAKPGFVMLRYSAPQKPDGVYEQWYHDMTQLGQEMWPAAVAAGALNWKVMTDIVGNTPRNTMMIEFAHADEAVRWLASPDCHSFVQRLTRIGTLDMQVSAYRLHSQS